MRSSSCSSASTVRASMRRRTRAANISALKRIVATCRRFAASAMHSSAACHMLTSAAPRHCRFTFAHLHALQKRVLAGVCASHGACSSERALLLRPAARHSRTRTVEHTVTLLDESVLDCATQSQTWGAGRICSAIFTYPARQQPLGESVLNAAGARLFGVWRRVGAPKIMEATVCWPSLHHFRAVLRLQHTHAHTDHTH